MDEALIISTQNRLSKEYVASLEAIRFDGEIVTVTEPEHAEEVCRELGGYKELGFDTESRPSFRRGVSYPVSLVQLSTLDKAYLFQLKDTELPDGLVKIFSDPSVKKIGVGIRDDIKKLRELTPFEEKGFVDLGDIAAEKGIIQFGARALAARYLGRKIVKSAQKTNWARRDLTDKQKNYAATDAWVCLLVYPLLLNDSHDYREYPAETPEAENE
ncbi:MAG: 3'-5' exonuclease domain-containing protein 2 [Geovibrio sp.]|jgi:ribonuclease D|uniref:3'-5' exonuclease n=1 Tax=Geovibrio ferrireducens TaxID=46201 RepID=UPI002247DB67|nr:3'-5' exonuclease [Geovibrio ferrireducens]MCD8568208.1 3'-5' exonuclease domain-containing protein 2 [Geovibrio sp.]